MRVFAEESDGGIVLQEYLADQVVSFVQSEEIFFAKPTKITVVHESTFEFLTPTTVINENGIVGTVVAGQEIEFGPYVTLTIQKPAGVRIKAGSPDVQFLSAASVVSPNYFLNQDENEGL